MSLTAAMYAPVGVTHVNGGNGVVYVVGANREVTVPVEMVPALLGAGFLETLIEPGTVTNASVASDAAIAYAKLNLAGFIKNADVASSAAIAYSKLNLAGSVTTADTAFTTVKVSGVQVVGAQQAAIANATPQSAHDQLNLLLAACRTHGLIAT